MDHANNMRAMANSAFFSSDIVYNEFERIMEQFRLLTELQGKWVDFDTAGKEMYLEKMRSFTERLGIYITRCKLSDDPGAKAMIHQLNVGYLNAGLSIDAMHAGWLEKTATMQTWVDAEKAISPTDCAAQSAFKAQLRQVFDESVPDLGWLLNDPHMAECLADPQALNVVRTVLHEPSAASRYKGTRMEPLALKVASMSRQS